MEKKKRIMKILKFLLQILVAAITSWGTASGYNAAYKDPVETSVDLDLDVPALNYGSVLPTTQEERGELDGVRCLS